MYADVLYESHFSNNSALHRHCMDHRIHLSNDADRSAKYCNSKKNTISLLLMAICQTSFNSVKLC